MTERMIVPGDVRGRMRLLAVSGKERSARLIAIEHRVIQRT